MGVGPKVIRRIWVLCVAAIVCFPLNVAAATLGTASGQAATGYWLVRADGATYPFGNASTVVGPASVIRGLNRPIVAVVSTPDRQGLWMVASDGGVFSFGNAIFAGSTGGQRLSTPMIGIAASG